MLDRPILVLTLLVGSGTAQGIRQSASIDQRLLVAPASVEHRHVVVHSSSHAVRRGLIGGAIGAVAGVGVCTLISNAVKDSGTGFSTCTTKGYLLLGGIGFAAGFTIGAATAKEGPTVP